MSTLIVRDLVKGFGPVPVLDGLDLRVADGEFAAVLGPSGCGKTTLLRLLAGFERVDGGTIEVGGRVLAGPGAHVRPERREIGIVPQEGALFPHLSVARNVAYGLRGPDRATRAAETLELVGLAGYGRRMPHQLSGGQQQRVALARALAPRPALILLDEPFNALDPALRAALRTEVREVLREAGTTALLVTHDQEEALTTADVVALMRDRRIVQTGSPREVYDRPADALAASFLGETVLVPGDARRGRVCSVLGSHAVHGERGPADGPGTVVLRPEQLRVVEEGVRVTVKDTVFLGRESVVLLAEAATGAEIRVRLNAYPPPSPGDTLHLEVAGTVSFFPSA